MKHELKLCPKYFDAVANRVKNFEVRKNDRPFAVGDTLILKEWDESITYKQYKSTGRSVERVVTYVFDDPDYCPEGYVILGLQ